MIDVIVSRDFWTVSQLLFDILTPIQKAIDVLQGNCIVSQVWHIWQKVFLVFITAHFLVGRNF
jgi:hypothetical protein